MPQIVSGERRLSGALGERATSPLQAVTVDRLELSDYGSPRTYTQQQIRAISSPRSTRLQSAQSPRVPKILLDVDFRGGSRSGH